MHSKGPSIPDINWLFVAPKLKKLKCSFWKNILGSWLNVKVGLAKSEPASHAEVLRQPIFNNPFILNTTGFIRATNSQVITLSLECYHLIKVLFQERHGAPYKVARELPSLTKLPLLWIFKFGFIDGLP